MQLLGPRHNKAQQCLLVMWGFILEAPCQFKCIMFSMLAIFQHHIISLFACLLYCSLCFLLQVCPLGCRQLMAQALLTAHSLLQALPCSVCGCKFFWHQPLLHWTVGLDLWQAWGRNTSSPRQQQSPRPPMLRSCRSKFMRREKKANGEHFSNWSLGKRALKKGQGLAKGPIPAKGAKSKDTCQKCSNLNLAHFPMACIKKRCGHGWAFWLPVRGLATTPDAVVFLFCSLPISSALGDRFYVVPLACILLGLV